VVDVSDAATTRSGIPGSEVRASGTISRQDHSFRILGIHTAKLGNVHTGCSPRFNSTVLHCLRPRGTREQKGPTWRPKCSSAHECLEREEIERELRTLFQPRNEELQLSNSPLPLWLYVRRRPKLYASPVVEHVGVQRPTARRTIWPPYTLRDILGAQDYGE
jgi:hypothetical protein